jgi:hypothetical protein
LAAFATVQAAQADPPVNDMVRILAGLEVDEDSSLAHLMASSAWQSYHRTIAQTWRNYDQKQHAKVESFREQWLPSAVRGGRDLLYPFAGADFLYADLFFPEAKNIYMFGLEPLGAIPSQDQLNSAYYNGVIRSTEDLLRLTFFRTKAMRDDFRYNGTVPLISYFIVHRGHVIQEITYLGLRSSGVPYETSRSQATGARIAFQDSRNGEIRSVWYWRGDLSNQGLTRNPELKAYIASLPPANLYMKAASYLCHHDYFSQACTQFRDHAMLSLQEDSGMPLRFYPDEEWQHTLFGTYRYPISVFSSRIYRQNDALKQKFQSAEQVQALPFRLGYHVATGAHNLMLAIREQAQP